MKKRWIPFALICLTTVFILGQLAGSSSESERQQSRNELQSGMTTAIAVVNADMGVTTENGRLNYSAAIIDTLGDNYTLVSSVMAHNGYSNGTYGAIITFPSDVSHKIISFNSNQPEKVQLEFQVNPNLSERDYVETYISILNLQQSINTTLAHTYVSSIYEQFHIAQDQVDGIFQNDRSNMSALDIVKLQEFSVGLDLDYLPDIQLDPKEADTTRYMEDVSGFADAVSSRYLDSYLLASSRYIPMREGFLGMTDGFPEQEEEWMSRLSDWSAISVEYGNELEEYSAAVKEHEEDLMDWYLENVNWNEALTGYQTNVADWHEILQVWFGEAGDWYTEYQSYLDAAEEYIEGISEYRTELAETTTQVMEDLNEWKENIETQTQELFEEIENRHIALDDWKEQLEEAAGTISGELSELETALNVEIKTQSDMLIGTNSVLQNWNVQLEEATDSIKDIYDILEEGEFDSIPGIDSLINVIGEYLDNISLNPISPPGDFTPINLADFISLLTDDFPILDRQWDDLNFDLPPYQGEEIPDTDTLLDDFPEPGLKLSEKPELEEPTEYDGAEEPKTVDEHDMLIAIQPYNPLVNPPPRPDNFWYTLNLMHDQLSSFDIEDYLSDDVKQQVDFLLQSYSTYLDTVRDDLSFQFDENIMKMHDVRWEYNEYLSDLRTDTLDAEAAEQELLQKTLDEYSSIKERNSGDTRERLSAFADMMPESRSPSGLNRNLVGFTVAPFDFIPPSLRSGAVIDTSMMQPLHETYKKYLWLVIPIAGGVFLVTILSYLISYLRKQKKDSVSYAGDNV